MHSSCYPFVVDGLCVYPGKLSLIITSQARSRTFGSFIKKATVQEQQSRLVTPSWYLCSIY